MRPLVTHSVANLRARRRSSPGLRIDSSGCGSGCGTQIRICALGGTHFRICVSGRTQFRICVRPGQTRHSVWHSLPDLRAARYSVSHVCTVPYSVAELSTAPRRFRLLAGLPGPARTFFSLHACAAVLSSPDLRTALYTLVGCEYRPGCATSRLRDVPPARLAHPAPTARRPATVDFLPRKTIAPPAVLHYRRSVPRTWRPANCLTAIPVRGESMRKVV